MHYLEIANRADENHIRLAIFSFAILASQASGGEILAHIAMLDEHLPPWPVTNQTLAPAQLRR